MHKVFQDGYGLNVASYGKLDYTETTCFNVEIHGEVANGDIQQVKKHSFSGNSNSLSVFKAPRGFVFFELADLSLVH